MLRSEEIEVDGKRYLVTQYTATRGNKLLFRLGKVMAKPGAILASLFSASPDKDLKNAAWGDLASAVFENATPEEFVSLSKDLLEGVNIIAEGQNRGINYDIDFAGEQMHLFSLLSAIVKFQFGPLWNGLASHISALARPVKAKR